MSAFLIPLLLSCTAGLPINIMRSIIKVESAGHLYAIHNGTQNKAYFPKTKTRAIILANSFIAKGHRLDIGLAQINTQNFKWLNLTVADAFDPCTNVKAGAFVLKHNYSLTSQKTKTKETALLQAISMYNSGNISKGFANGYVEKVIKAGLNVEKYKTFKSNIKTKKTPKTHTISSLKFKTRNIYIDKFDNTQYLITEKKAEF